MTTGHWLKVLPDTSLPPSKRPQMWPLAMTYVKT